MRNRITFIVLLLVTISVVHAQEYKKFRLGLGLGYAKAGGEGAGGGALWAIEPGHRINDKLLVSMRLEVSSVVRDLVDDTLGDFDAAGIRSYTINGQYYLRKHGFCPFAGIGLGIYSVGSLHFFPAYSGTSLSSASDRKVGLYPRIGFDVGHFTFCLDYNLLGNTRATITTSDGSSMNSEFKNSYIGFRLGGYFGGGRK